VWVFVRQPEHQPGQLRRVWHGLQRAEKRHGYLQLGQLRRLVQRGVLCVRRRRVLFHLAEVLP